MKSVDLLLLGASQVVTVDGGRAGPKRGARDMNKLGVVEDGAVAVHRGRVVAVGTTNEITSTFRGLRRVFCRGRTILPGFVDAHTHPVFAKMREDEFAMRCRGADYEEILAAGGGIHASARALRIKKQGELVEGIRERLDNFLLHGTTVVEGKSGYGLTFESELKSLKALRQAGRGHPVSVVRTFLGAHAVPPEFRRKRNIYVSEVAERMMPEVARQKLADFCDIFVERGAFTIPEAEIILKSARRHGLKIKVHADQFRDGGGALLAAKFKATSVEHVDATRKRGIDALKKARVIPVLLPSASLFMGLKHVPQARRFIDAGLPVALATDFNPGTSPTENLGLVASLGCSLLGMTPEEVIVAITRNAAAAVGREDRHGRIAPGRRANFVILDAPSYTYLPYRMGTNLVHSVIVRGREVVRAGRILPRKRR
ncbi:MAG: imidazolonepropionase [Planctomycetota bacterium]|nr:imidazolonepropionase [Planctomycetota bacterium]